MSRTRRVWLRAPAGWAWVLLLTCGRAATGEVPGPAVHFAVVPGTDAQPFGPTYDFRVARTEVTNAQFVAFLNDALTTSDGARSAFLHVDAGTGDVYWGSSAPMIIGAPPEPTRPKLFSPAVAGQIEFDGAVYAVRAEPADYTNHPVAGVSWLGAVKYCNWLTLATGLSPSDRAYGESGYPNATGWRPVTIAATDWATRDLNYGERLALLDVAGFRLPMSRPGVSTSAGAYNEWFKAAAWDRDGAVNRQFGFGRDVLTEHDANYLCSGDPFEEAGNCNAGTTTPVGMYNGSVFGGVFPTNTDANSYGLKDASGNVWEWMQDQGASPSARDNRGGSFRSAGVSLATNLPAWRDALSLVDSTGFRVVQSGRPALQVTPDQPAPITTVWGGPAPPADAVLFTLLNRSSAPLEWAAATASPWAVLDAPSTSQSLAPNTTAAVTLSWDMQCDPPLGSGTHDVLIAIEDLTNERIEVRTVQLTVIEPLAVEPIRPVTVSVFAGDSSADAIATYVLTSTGPSEVVWSVDVTDTTVLPPDAEWLTVEPREGVIFPGEAPTATVSVYVHAAMLPIGTYTANVVFRDVCTGYEFARPVSVSVMPPITLTGPDEASFARYCDGVPTPQSYELAVTNRRSETLQWSAAVTPSDVFVVTPSSGVLEGGSSITLRAEVAPDVPVNAPSTVVGGLSVQTADGGYGVSRPVRLQTDALPIEPTSNITLAGPRYGPFAPAGVTLTLTNPLDEELPWSAYFIDQSDPPVTTEWVAVEPSVGVLLALGDEADILIALTSEAAVLPEGMYTGRVVVDSPLSPGCASSVLVQLQVGSEAHPLVASVVRSGASQPGGPIHSFRLGRTEVTNEEFARFLNDAESHPADPRGQYLTFDATTGRVALSGDETLLFDPAVAADIVRANAAHHPAPGREHLPVSGVTWIGAAKYANWLTLSQGMTEPDQRAFHEGPTIDDWYPVAADPAEYFTNGMSVAERETLATSVFGFRLPMDDGVDGPSVFNEWHCAAAWHPTQAQNRIYGFGRSTLTPSDANYFASCDPFESSGPSPVGYYDGDQPLAAGCGVTSATGNYHQLMDLCGNVAEWVMDFGNSPGTRAARGGDFSDPAGSVQLRNDSRRSEAITTASRKLGFRLSQSVFPVLPIVTRSPVRVHGVRGGPLSDHAVVVEVTNGGPQSLDDVTVSSTASWLPPQAPEHPIIPPQHSNVFTLTVSKSAAIPMAPPSTVAGELVFVSPDDAQPGGPDYAYWVGRTEVTNAQFAAFLNDAMADALSESPGPRSAYMLFDTLGGRVYINDEAEPSVQSGIPELDPLVLLYDGDVGQIKYAATAWAVTAGLADHPVVGVSWFGAVKFCNWKTMNEGLPNSQRAYSEGPSTQLDRWKPVTITSAVWANGVFTDADRQAWLEAVTGFRLPLDGATASASEFNEWHKAAAWDADDGAEYVYGFGRDLLTREDANYFLDAALTSSGTTPVGYFDGTNLLPTTIPACAAETPQATTNASRNFYRLSDMSGNASEWTSECGSAPSLRIVRGGSWRDTADSALLRTDGRGALLAESVRNDVGFRLFASRGRASTVNVLDGLSATLQSLDVILDVDDPLLVAPRAAARYTSSLGGATDITPTVLELTNRSSVEVAWSVSVDVSWLQVGHDAVQSGVLAGQSSLFLQPRLTAAANGLPPGEHVATITFGADADSVAISREVRLNISRPASFVSRTGAVAFSAYVGNFPAANPAAVELDLISVAATHLEYDISADSPWLTVDPPGALQGVLVAGGERSFVVGLADAAAELPVGRHTGSVTAHLTDPATGANWVESVIATVHVLDPLRIEPASIPIVLQRPSPGEPLQSIEFLASNSGSGDLEVFIYASVPWLTVPGESITLPESESTTLAVLLNDACWELTAGLHDAIVTFSDATWGHAQCRVVRLVVGEPLSLTPAGVVELSMAEGGLALPSLIEVGVAHSDPDGDPVSFDFTLDFSGKAWLALPDGGATTSGTLAPGMGTSLGLMPVPFVAGTLAPGEHTATLTLTNASSGVVQTRSVRLTVLRPKVDTPEVHVGGTAAQPGGPQYSFRLGTYAVRNADFVKFLNDALLHIDGAAAEYLYFDLDSGSVYVHDASAGATGTGAQGHSIKVFVVGTDTPIHFDGAAYTVATDPMDLSQHPVTGVSWYGAIKYANWLTLDSGLPSAERAVVEAPSSAINEWRPVTISTANWVARDLNDAERAALAGNYRGYRLPMDDGHNNPNPASDSADAFNEWFKAAAWNTTSSTNAVFAFGRNMLTGMDANYRNSGDPFDNGPTPVGYYGGPNGSDVFPANGNANAFGAYDLCGNVYQWVLGRYNGNGNSIAFRTLRGGSWNDPPTAEILRTTGRTFAAPGLTDPLVGFRVTRVLPPGDGDLVADGGIDVHDYTVAAYCLAGPGILSQIGCEQGDRDDDGDLDLGDIASLFLLQATEP